MAVPVGVIGDAPWSDAVSGRQCTDWFFTSDALVAGRLVRSHPYGIARSGSLAFGIAIRQFLLPATTRGYAAVLMFGSSSVRAAAITMFMALSASAAAQEGGSTLPGGASSLQETYQDWSLSCQSTPVACVVSQQQAQQDGQRLLAIELRKGGDGGISGNLVLPFGLLLDTGATLQIDDGPPREPLGFSTCLPAGCLVPLSFNAKTVATLRTGTTLRIKVKSIDQKDVALSVSLKGLAAALDRLKVLAGA